MHFSSLFFILNHFSPMVQHLLVGQGLLITEASRSHSDTPHSVGVLFTSARTVAELIPDNTQHSKGADIHAPGGIRTRNPSKRAVTDPRLRPRDCWNKHPPL